MSQSSDRSLVPIFVLSLSILMMVSAGTLGTGIQAAQAAEEDLPNLDAPLGKSLRALHIGFEENRGQIPEQFDFVIRTPRYIALIGRSEVTISPTVAPGNIGPGSNVLEMRLDGAIENGSVEKIGLLPGKINYLRSRSASKHATGIAHYSRVKYKSIYPGVDLVYRTERGHLRIDFVVRPTADPSQIKLRTIGAKSALLGADGSLVVPTGGAAYRFREPKMFQRTTDGNPVQVDGGYTEIANNLHGFRIAEYNSDRPLVIDPTLEFGTYLGGVGIGENSSGTDKARGIAVDDLGNSYITGSSNSPVFPTKNPLQGELDLSTPNIFASDAFIAKLSADAGELIYATYLGGPEWDEGNAIAVDSTGHAYIAGMTTFEEGFLPGRLHKHGSCGGINDAFVTKLNPDGASAVYTAVLCGERRDVALGVALDSLDQPTIVGMTESLDFPTANCNAVLGFCNNGTAIGPSTGDAFVTKLTADGASLVFSTYIGGGLREVANGVAIHDQTGNIIVVGETESGTNPLIALPTVNALFPDHPSSVSSGFVVKYDAEGVIEFLTFLGGISGYDEANAVAIDRNGDLYVTGSTGATDFPIMAPIQSSPSGNGDIFVTKIKGDGSALVYSTFIGGNGGDEGRGIAVDKDGRAHIVGRISSNSIASFPIVRQIQGSSSDAIENGVVLKLGRLGNKLLYSTFLGGPGDNILSAIALDSRGNAYVAGHAWVDSFPTTADVVQPDNSGTSLNGIGEEISQADVTVAKITDPLQFTYVTKVVCGRQISPVWAGRLAIGLYGTSVNIYNPTDEPVWLSKTLALASGLWNMTLGIPFETPGPVVFVDDAVLKPGQALMADCVELKQFAIGPAFEGFLRIESSGQLSVTSVYTAGPAGTPGNPNQINRNQPPSIDVEAINESGGGIDPRLDGDITIETSLPVVVGLRCEDGGQTNSQLSLNFETTVTNRGSTKVENIRVVDLFDIGNSITVDVLDTTYRVSHGGSFTKLQDEGPPVTDAVFEAQIPLLGSKETATISRFVNVLVSNLAVDVGANPGFVHNTVTANAFVDLNLANNKFTRSYNPQNSALCAIDNVVQFGD